MKQKAKISLLLLTLALALVLSISSVFAQDFDNSTADLAIYNDEVISIENQDNMIVNIVVDAENHVSFVSTEELKSAGDTVEPIPQVDSGVVSGGVDFTAVHPADTAGNLVYTIPEDITNVKSAIVIVNVYSGSADNTFALYSNVTLNTNNGQEVLGYETLYLNKNVENDPNVYSINDHTTKQDCEYQMIYDITNRVNNLNSGDAITVNVANSPYGSKEFDGRIKLIGLLFAYDDGDNDNYTYWLHAGQLWTQTSANFDFNTRNYAGKTDNISLRKIALTSKAAHTYKINDVECGYDSATTLVFNYKDIKWNNISSNFVKGSDTNFWFETSGAYKTSVALLIASEVEPLTEVYVDYANGNDRNVGTSNNSAFKTIGRALDKVEENGVIYVSGTNYLDGVDVNGLSINKNVSIIGLGSDAIINAENNCRIFNIGNYAVSLSNLIFINGNAGSASVKRGGALYVDGSDLTIDNCKFVNNGAGSSTSDGRAIYLQSSTTSISNSALLDGQKSVWIDGGVASLENNWWGNNETNKNSNPKSLGYTNANVNSYLYLTMTMFARGMDVGDTASVNVMLVSNGGSGSEISNLPVTLSAVNGILDNDNIVMMNGLASSVYTITATGSNSVTANVFGIEDTYTLSSSDVVSTEVIYVNSTGGSDSNSGANWNKAVQTIEKAISIVDNGGTIYLADGLYILSDSTPATGIPITKNVTIVGQSINSVISGNNAKRIFSIGVGNTLNISKLTLTDAYITGGQAFGGAILIEDAGNTNPIVAGKLIIADSVISNSHATYGGAIGTNRGSIDNVVNVTFVNNSASAGGALYIQSTNSIFSIGNNCKFINNSATGRGSAIYSQSKVSTGKDNLFYGNNASGRYGYGTIFAYGFELGTGNVFADNVATTGGALYLGGTKFAGLANYCIFINNIDSNGYTVAKQTARLQLTLDNCYWGTNTPDFSTLCNIGEITYTDYLTLNITSNNNQPNVGNSAVVNVDLTKNQNGVTVDVDSLPDVLPLIFTVTNGNVNPAITELAHGVASTTYSPEIMGEGSVTANIYSLAETYNFNVLPELGTIFVNYTGGLDTNTGDSWNTAVKTIAHALEIVGKGKTIYIADGVNYLDDVNVNGLTIRKNVNIIGIGDNVVIDANNNARIFDIGAYSVKLSNLIFVNGNASGASAKRGGALYVSGANLTIDNCKFINNTAGVGSVSYGGAINLKSSSTTIMDSYFENNIAFTGGAAINANENNVLLNISTSTFKDNLASGGSARGAAICAYNTTIIDRSIFYGNGFTASGRNGKSVYEYGPDSLTITNSILLDGEKGVWINTGTTTTLTNNWWGNNETTKNSNPKSLGYTNANVDSYLVLSSKIGQENVYMGDLVTVTTTLQNNLVELPVILDVNKGKIDPKNTSLITSSASIYNATEIGNVVITIDVLGIKNEIGFPVKETLPVVSITEVKTQWKDGIYPAVNNTFTITLNNMENHTVEGLVLEVYSNETGELVASYTIDSLDVGTSTISVTDPTIRPLTEQSVWPAPNNDKIKFTFNLMRGDDVAYSLSVDKMLAYNGYFNKTYAYGGHDNIINRKYTISGDIIIATQDVSVYMDQYSRFRNETWNIQTPEDAEIVKVLLYFNFNWDTSYYPNGWNLMFNEAELIGTNIGYEMDRGNLGGWGSYNYGSLVFDVTDYYRANANNSFIISKTGNCALYPSTLYVLYNVSGSNSVKDIYFTDICDVFYPNYNMNGYDDLLSVIVNFNDIDLQNMVKATWYAFGGSGGSPDADLKFNDLTVLNAYKDDSANDCKAYELDVTDIISQNNLAQFITTTRSTTIVAYEQVLVVEKVKLITNLNADNLVMKYKDGSSWDVTLTDNKGNAIPNADVKIGIVGKIYTIKTDDNGVASLPINLVSGTYVVNATFDGDEGYENSFVNATITVNKVVATLSADNLELRYKDGSAWAVTLTDSNGNAIGGVKVAIGIAGKMYYMRTDDSGVARLLINLTPNNYEVNASFSDNRYEAQLITAMVIVNRKVTVLSADDLVMDYGDGSTFYATLTDTKGNPINHTNVEITVEGKTYYRKTNENGVASMPINLPVGTYNISAKYVGAAKFDGVEINKTIVVNMPEYNLAAQGINMIYNDRISAKRITGDVLGVGIIAADSHLNETSIYSDNFSDKSQRALSSSNEEVLSDVNTDPMPNIEKGVVSGGVDFTNIHPWGPSDAVNGNKGNITYKIPATATDIKSAYVFVNIYSGSGNADTYGLHSNVTLTTDDSTVTLGCEDLTFSGNQQDDPTVYIINDHTTKVYSDYMMVYNVTDFLQGLSGTSVSVDVLSYPMKGKSFDGRIKLIALFVAWEDGDSDEIDYWLNAGQAWTNDVTYGISHTFEDIDFDDFGSSDKQATLINVGGSSADAFYLINGQPFFSENEADEYKSGAYYQYHKWDVSNYIDSDVLEVGYAAVSGAYGPSFKTLVSILLIQDTPDYDDVQISVESEYPDTCYAGTNNTLNVKVTAPEGKYVIRLLADGKRVNQTGEINLNEGFNSILLTDPTIRPVDEFTVNGAVNKKVNYTVEVLSNGYVKNSSSILLPILYNGNLGKDLAYPAGSLDSFLNITVNGDIVIVPQNYSHYISADVRNRTEVWDIDLDDDSNIVKSFIYIPYYEFNSKAYLEDESMFNVTFNDVNIIPIALYRDQSNLGMSYYSGYGVLVYEVTSLINKNGKNYLKLNKKFDTPAVYPSALIYMYNTTVSNSIKEIYIYNGADLLEFSNNLAGRKVHADTMIDVNSISAKDATLYVFAAGPQSDEGNLIFNGEEHNNIWDATSSSYEFYTLNVTDSLKDSNSISFVATGTRIIALQQIMVIDKKLDELGVSLKSEYPDTCYAGTNNYISVNIKAVKDNRVTIRLLADGHVVNESDVDLIYGLNNFTLVDPTIRPADKFTVSGAENKKVTYTVEVLSNGNLVNSSSIICSVLYNGNLGKDLAYPDGGIESYLNVTINGDIVIDVKDDSSYLGLLDGNVRNDVWNVNLDDKSSVVKAFVYVPYGSANNNFIQEDDMFKVVTFNGKNIDYTALYRDQTNLGDKGQYGYGLLVYDVTDLLKNGKNTFKLERKTPYPELYPSALVYMYNIEGSTITRNIYISNGADLLSKDPNRPVHIDSTISADTTSDVAKLYIFAANAQNGEGAIVFNGNNHENVWEGSDKSTDLYTLDISNDIKKSNGISFVVNEGTILALQQMIVTTQKSQSRIVASDLTIPYNTSSSLIISLDNGNGKVISDAELNVVFNGNSSVLITDKDGKVSFDIPSNLLPGSYDVIISYSGDDNYQNSSKTVKLIVDKIPTQISASDLRVSYNTNNNISIVLNGAYDKAISDAELNVVFNGKSSVLITDKDGKVSFDIPSNLLPGSYEVSISYSGDDNYQNSSKTVKVVFDKIPTQITASDLTVPYNANENISIVLSDVDGDFISDAELNVILNGNSSVLITDKDGKVSLAIPASLIPNNYKISISYKGDEAHKESSKTLNLVVKKASTQIGATQKTVVYNTKNNFTATLKDTNGNAIANSKVTIVLNGNSSVLTTDNNGQVSLAVPSNLLPGSYDVSISYSGDDKYYSSSKAVKLIVDKISTQIGASDLTVPHNTNNTLSIVLSDVEGNFISNAELNVVLNGKSSVLTTDKYGIASFDIPATLLPNTYKISISYKGDEAHKESSKTVNLVVNSSNGNVISYDNLTIFIVSDNPGTNVLDAACKELYDEYGLKNVNFVVRSGAQIKDMDESEFIRLLYDCDAFIGEWVSTDVDAVLTSALNKDSTLSDKKIFLILEPPVGNLNSESSSIGLIRQSSLNNTKIFNSISDEELISYFKSTRRGTTYSDVEQAISDYGSKFNGMFNKMVLYKDIHDKDNLKNQLLYVLNYFGMDIPYNEPSFTDSKLYGIYRDKWYSLDEYMEAFFKPENTRTIGILESTMYISSQQLHPCIEIMEYFESKGYNVIPVFAAGATPEQLKVMVESFTSAGTDISGFISNSSNYDIYVDAIISVVAYGVGGENFTATNSFFEELGVPVFRAVHSDYVSNEQWELGSSGLTTEKSDKWWHVAIAEAQGIIDATFIGGSSSYISNTTGARIVTYIPHHGNIELLCDRIDSWVDLQYMSNSEKLISLIYYNYPPGKQNIGSSYLDTITSIYNMLYYLKEEGYNVGELPSSVSELEDLMLKCGINVATWAPGELEKLANQSDVVLLPVSEYTGWFDTLPEIVKIQVREGPIPYIGELAKRSVELNYTVTIGDTIDDWYNQIVALLPENKSVEATKVLENIVAALKNYTATQDYEYYNLFLSYYEEFKQLNIDGLTGWGESPGEVMVVNRNGTDYFVIPGLTFGNVFIAPEPQRGWESDIENLYHCTAVAPTHQYLAAYYYMQTYHPNAMVFTGRHATHEWLPGKEILLSSTDYGSVVVGEVPQLYFYITDGLGEAIQAKRRGFAVLISHLTSPLSYTHLYGNLTAAANLVDQYLNAKDQSSKNKISEELRNLIIDNDYSMNLGLTKEDVLNLTADSLVDKINTFLISTQSTIYPLGLHAIGQYWNEQDLASTVSVMMSFDFTLPNNGGETNLFDEIALYYYSSKYDSLSAFQREFVSNKVYDICKALIYWDVETVQYVLLDSGNNFDNSKLLASLELAKKYINLINDSVQAELVAMIDGLNGKYIPISEGGEIIAKPHIMPTGRNMFQDQSNELPTPEAYEYAKTLALLTLSGLNDTTEKVIMGIWCVETARDDGALVASVLYLLGMKPVWTDSPSAGVDQNHDHDDESTTGKKVKSMPEYVKLVDLERPEGWAKKRIDVTVITSGLFRDLYSSQTIIMDNAFRVALARSYLTITSNKTLMESEYGPQVKEAIDYIMEGIGYYGVSGANRESLDDNYVAKHWLEDCLYYLSIGYNATYAGECAITRIFAPPNGDYGAGISKLVSMSWTWNSTDELADFYLGRMGNMYSKNYWGDTNPLVFLRALSNSDTIVASRNTNQYGVLDNDDFFDYWGGLSMTVEKISGKAPNFNVLMYANKDKAYIASLEEVMYQEIASRYDNPEWIKAMMKEGYSGARYMSNKFVTNLLGWQVTRPSAVSGDLWNRVYDTYFNDKYNLGVTDWLKSGNNAYSFISMGGTMLTAIKEGYWNADDATIRNIANSWAQATVTSGVACCDCSCGNIAMMQWAVQYVNPDILAQLLPKLYEATKNPVFLNNTQNAQPQDVEETSNVDPSSPNPVEGSDSSSTVVSNSTSNTQSSSQSSSNSQNSGSQQGQAASNVGVNGQTSNSEGKSAADTGEVSEISEINDDSQAGSSSSQGADVKKSIEINPITSQSASEVGLSIIAVIGVLCLIGVIALGYFRNRDEEEKVRDLDKLFNEKVI